MVDISMEILASSVPIRNGYMARYRVKTWWAHIDVPPDVTFIKLPRLPMIQPFLIMTGKDTTIFVETWQDHKNCIVGGGGGDGGVPVNRTVFLGITTCSVDEQLKTPNLNPSVQWLDVHDPIEDTSRGKLLVKIDAKFVIPEENKRISSPARSTDNRHSYHGGGGSASNDESPIKMVQSPRRSFAPNYQFDYNHSSPNPNVQHISSRKSDTSVFSVRSSSSVRSQEQGVQTDLSLPIIPDISKFTAQFFDSRAQGRQFSSGVFPEDPGRKLSGAHRSSGITSVTPMDPLKFAEDILKRKLINNDNSTEDRDRGGVRTQNQRRTSEPVSTTSNKRSSEFRRSCLVRQHVHQQDNNYQPSQDDLNEVVNLEGQRRHSETYDMESLEDVIDMLNNETRDNAFCHQLGIGSPTVTSIPAVRDSSSNKPPIPRSSMTVKPSGTGNRGPPKITGITKLPSSGSVEEGSSGALKRESVTSTSTVSRAGSGVSADTVRNNGNGGGGDSPYHQTGRFKEIHFDGAQAKQQATSILMTRTTAQVTNQQQPVPVVTRRRIAAAIFND